MYTNEHIHRYGRCPKISYTKVSDKMAYANSANPDQTAPDPLSSSVTQV